MVENAVSPNLFGSVKMIPLAQLVRFIRAGVKAVNQTVVRITQLDQDPRPLEKEGLLARIQKLVHKKRLYSNENKCNL